VKKTVSLIMVSIITLATLTYALWDVNFPELGKLLAGGDYRLLLPILALLVLFYWMKALRWVYILRPLRHFTRAEVTPAMVIGFAGNNILPAHLGEVIRTVVFARRFSMPYSSVAITLLVERIFDLVAILSLYAVGMAAIGKPPESLQVGTQLIMLLMIGFFVTIAIILYRPSLVLGTGNWLAGRLPESLGRHLNGILTNVIKAFSSLKSPQLVIFMLTWSLLKWAVMAGMIWLSLVAYGTSVSVGIPLVLMAVLALAAAVPNAPGYVGAMQAAYVFTLRPFGISEEVAFAASVLFLVCQWLPVTLAGAWYFISGGLHVDEVRREIEAVEEKK
jgi:uncharacterized protein (TIRG00374 family)